MPRSGHRPKLPYEIVGSGPWKLSAFLFPHRDPGRFPLAREQFGQLTLRMPADAFEDIAQVSEGIEAKPFASRNEAGEYCPRATAVVAPQKDPIFATIRTFQ